MLHVYYMCADSLYEIQGANVAQALANALPENWRVVVIDRNRFVLLRPSM